jgi:hypothetical protein
MLVPYSKENETAKLPISRNIFLTIGPAHADKTAYIISRVEEQGWIARFVVFAGTIKASAISMATQPSIPVYNVLVCKRFNEGEELIEPII